MMPTGLVEDVGQQVKTLAGDWSKYTVIGSFALYLTGYLALRFHLTTIGVGTDLAVLDERYLFTGARFFVYLVSSVPNVVLVVLPLAAIGAVAWRRAPERTHVRAALFLADPRRLTLAGVVFSVVVIQFVMRQCFVFTNVLLAPSLPTDPAWLVAVFGNEMLKPLYFSALVGACAVPLGILIATRGMAIQSSWAGWRGLLAFLTAVQVLLLPINYGILIVDKSVPRVSSLGPAERLAVNEDAWLVWEGKDGVTFLVRSRPQNQRRMVTLPRADVNKRIEIVGFEPIVSRLFGAGEGASR
jgi:hypothetical protein